MTPEQFRVHVAGMVRDSAQGLLARLEGIEDAIVESLGATPHFHLFENDSSDRTRELLEEFRDAHENVILHLEDGLVDRIPVREQRIAHGRNVLLESILSLSGALRRPSDIYLPVDLDLDIDWSDLAASLRSAVTLVRSGAFDGVLPSSAPFYYDIHALRASGWNESDAWSALNRARRSRTGRRAKKWFLRAYFIHSRQFDPEGLRWIGSPIEVESAFGGFGVYDCGVLDQRRYQTSPADLCEHVGFNRGMRLAILPNLIIDAPEEHLGLPQEPDALRSTITRLLRRWRFLRWRRRVGRARQAAQQP